MKKKVKRVRNKSGKLLKKDLLIGALIGLLAGLLIGFIAFGVTSPISNSSGGDCIKSHWGCDVNLDAVSCYRDSYCLPINGVCNLQTYKCVPVDVDDGFSVPETEEACVAVDGTWALFEGC